MIFVETFRDLWRLLDRKGRVRAVGLVALLAISGALEIAGMFFLFGYIAALNGAASGGRLAPFVGIYRDFVGGYEGAWFALVAGAVLVSVFAIKNALWLLSSFALLRFVMKRYERVATGIFDGYQEMPLDLMRSRGTLGPIQVLGSTLTVFRNSFRTLLLAFADVAVVIAMLVALVVVLDPGLVVVSGLVIGVTAILFLNLTRRLSDSLGERIHKAQIAISEVMGEGLRGLLDVRLAGKQEVMRDRFASVAGEFALADRRIRALEMAPRALNELVLAAGIAFAATWFATSKDGLAGSLPALAVLGFAGLRVTSAAARLTQSLQQMRQAADARQRMMDAIERAAPQLLSGPSASRSVRETYRMEDLPLPDGAPRSLSSAIRVDHVSFTYPEADSPAIEDISLEIPVGSFTAFCGPSGGGKSTLALLVMGLLRPASGSITCDGWDIQRHQSAWHAQIGHVGQAPFMAAKSVRENVAIGTPPDLIDDEDVWQALETAAVADIFRSHALGLEVRLAEDGLSLSGGQRQRVAIARALYRDPAVLVFDEATAALDTATEREVSRAIANLRGGRTVIAIAHRLTTIVDADRIYLIEKGRIAASGTYRELIDKSSEFRKLAGDGA